MGKNEGKNKRKIFSVSMVKNEADIIESFVRYHQHIFDGMVFLDNMSSDRTPEILEKLREEGLPIYVSYDVDHGYAQKEKTTQLMRRTFSQFNPDIILPLDADEFLVSTNHLVHPRDILNKINLKNELHHIKWRTYVLNEAENKNELFIPKRITHARDDHHENLCKVLVSSQIVNNFTGTLVTGNHTFLIRRKKHKVKVNTLEDLKIAHFPIRSLEQFKSKLLVAWINRLARNEGNELYLKRFVQAIKNGRGLSNEDLFHLAKNFPFKTDKDIKIVHKPLDLTFCKSTKLKYTKENEVNAFLNFFENCEEMARSLAMLKNSGGGIS